MFKSNFKFAFRNMYKNFFFSIINVTGLAVGIACVLFIFFYIQAELAYDSFNEKYDRIYRVVLNANFNGNDFNTAEIGGVVGPTMQKDFPEIETYTRFNTWGIFFVRYENTSFKEYNIIAADSTFFEVFSIPVIKGDADKILTAPETVAISRRAAEKYFGDQDPIGKILHFDERETYSIAGVYENFPQNSHFDADFIVSAASIEDINQDMWTNCNYYTYIVVKENASVDELESKLPSLMKNYGWPEIEKAGLDVNQLLENGVFWDFALQPLSDVHFDTYYEHSLKPSTDIKYIYIFSAIALFILIIASINFINLSTARSANRAKEVGIKKVIGSFKKDLIVQFLTESVLLSCIAFVAAIGIVELFKPFFFNILGQRFEISYINNLGFGVTLVCIIIFTGILAGSFPAFVLSNFQPVTVLKGTMSNAMKRGWMRSGLVVFQFTASLILIIGTLVIFKQLHYMQNKKLGFDKEQVLVIDDPYILKDQSKIFRDEVVKHQDVLNGTISGYLPIDSYRSSTGQFRDGNRTDPKLRPLQRWRIDYNYFETLGINFLQGRNFSREFSTDENAVIINKACLDYFELENPLEHSISRYMSETDIGNFPIIGVVENFHFTSLKNRIEPIVFYLQDHAGYAAFKIKGNIREVVDYTENLWDKMAPSQPFSYRFMDEAFNKEYKSEESILKLFRSFAVLAVLIGCLGLFGLSAFTAEKKTKEIGIRKVCGATVASIIVNLSKEFALLVGIAIIFSAPIAYVLMHNWLQSYAYRTELTISTFLLAGLLAFSIAIFTVSYHAIKASLINPAKSLRYE